MLIILKWLYKNNGLWTEKTGREISSDRRETIVSDGISPVNSVIPHPIPRIN
jgi:hypothetical protein